MEICKQVEIFNLKLLEIMFDPKELFSVKI